MAIKALPFGVGPYFLPWLLRRPTLGVLQTTLPQAGSFLWSVVSFPPKVGRFSAHRSICIDMQAISALEHTCPSVIDPTCLAQGQRVGLFFWFQDHVPGA